MDSGLVRSVKVHRVLLCVKHHFGAFFESVGSFIFGSLWLRSVLHRCSLWFFQGVGMSDHDRKSTFCVSRCALQCEVFSFHFGGGQVKGCISALLSFLFFLSHFSQ